MFRKQVSSASRDAQQIGLAFCGSASRRTRGWPNQPLYEGGFPPFNTIFFH
jgi:hypothetical protein